MATALWETSQIARFNTFSMASIEVSMLTYDGTSTPANEIDSRLQDVLNGKHGCFNIES